MCIFCTLLFFNVRFNHILLQYLNTKFRTQLENSKYIKIFIMAKTKSKGTDWGEVLKGVASVISMIGTVAAALSGTNNSKSK